MRLLWKRAKGVTAVQGASWIRALRGCLITLFVLVILGGCKDNSLENLTWEEFDRATAPKHLAIFTKAGPVEVQKRAALALTKLEDDVADSRPMLIRALVVREQGELLLRLTYWDEDTDVRGFRLRERHEQANGEAVVIEEDYPVFIGDLRSATAGTPTFRPITRRENLDARKDESAWSRYEYQVLNMLVEKCAHADSMKTLSTTTVEAPMPTIYMALAEAPHVQVEMAVYDRSGNVSYYTEVYFSVEPVK